MSALETALELRVSIEGDAAVDDGRDALFLRRAGADRVADAAMARGSVLGPLPVPALHRVCQCDHSQAHTASLIPGCRDDTETPRAK